MSKEDKSWSRSASSNGTGKQSLTIPTNARDIKLVVNSGNGGEGGKDSDDEGGDGGAGREGEFEFKSAYNFKGFKLEVWMGKEGGDGEDEKTGSGGGSAGDSGNGPGGRGGDTAPFPYSGGGGGGGGATVVKYIDPSNSKIIVCAGGGGGGGGASRNRPGDKGKDAGSFSSDSSINVSSGQAGKTQAKCDGDPNDGGGGGGGGGGAPGGEGGEGGSDDNFCSQRAQGGRASGSKYNNTYLSEERDEAHDGNGSVEVEWEEITPEISTWKSDPENQYSILGVPKYSHTLEWSGKDYDWAGYKKLKIDGEAVTRSYTVTTDTKTIDITNLSQTNADTPGKSPRSTKWRLTLCIGGKDGLCVNEDITVKHKNDNKPSNTWTTKFTGLAPKTTVVKKIGKLAGVDMPTIITSDTNGVTFSKYSTDIGGDFDVSYTFEKGDNVHIRATTADWNTDVSGLAYTAEYGKTNSILLNVQPGGKAAFNVEFETKAPKIKETFNYGNVTGKYPHPDIDLINNSPSSEMVTNEVTVNDLDIPRPFRSSNSNIKISINNGNWTDVKNLNPKRV